jgi:hypothetical protein
MAMAPAAFVLCGAQQRTIANAHSTARRRSPAVPFREYLGERKFETLRFTEGECIMEWKMAYDARSIWMARRARPTAIGTLVLWPLISVASCGIGPGHVVAAFCVD